MNRIIRVNQQRLARLDRAIELTMPRATMKGRYKMDAARPDGRIRPLTGWFDNLITDYGLNYIGTSANQLNYCCVGSGNTAPANGNTALVSLVAGGATVLTTTGTVQPSSPYYGARTNVYQFAQGAAAGNLAEVGVGPNTGGTNLWSRALILDSGGSPTTITVLSDEFLNVTYELQFWPSITDTTGTVVIAGVTYNWTARASAVTSGAWTQNPSGDNMIIGSCTVYNGAIGAITGSPAGSASGATSITAGSYSSGSLISTLVGTFGLSQGNFTLPGGVTALSFNAGTSSNTSGSYQIGFADGSGHGIQKDTSSVMTMTMSMSWGRGTS